MPAAATHPRGWVEPLKGKDRMHQQATRISEKKVSTLRRDLTIDESHPDSTHVQIRLGSGDGNILREGYIREYGIEADEISEYFSGLPMKFCEKCTIRLISCHLGENRRLAERIRKRTGCKVDVYEGVLSPWFPPDSKPRNTYPPMWTPSIIGGFYYAY